MNDTSTPSDTISTPAVARKWGDILRLLESRPDVSTVYLGPYYAAVKINSNLHHIGDQVQSLPIAAELIARLNEEEQNERLATGSVIVRQHHPNIGTLKVRLFTTNGGEAAVITRFDDEAPEIDPATTPDAFLRAISRPSGFAIIAAPNGTGLEGIHAAATQAAADRHGNAVIAYIGSPPRHQLSRTRSLTIYIEVGPRKDQARFSNAIAMASEEGANIIAVDGALETGDGLREALRAARSGALVLATARAQSTLDLLRHMHTLLPASDREHYWATFAQHFLAALSIVRVPGRFAGQDFAAPELLINVPSLLSPLISFETMALANHLAGDREASVSRDTILTQLVAEQKITPETAAAYARDPDRLGRRSAR
jgi:Tfp pilus assembly pilus retraction ATPase PilT